MDQDVLLLAKQVIAVEVEGLTRMAERLDESVVRAVSTLMECRGRVIVIGMGKSGIIGRKIAATFASTGTPSFFVHPGEAFHGDLGMIQPSDVVIAISKSGNTPEIKMLAPLLKRFGNKLVAMVGNMDSELAHMADFVINSSIDKEACPNNLAPTTSTTAQMLMGDALAIALLKSRNFTEKDFSQFHLIRFL